jgi:hypothetical protein
MIKVTKKFFSGSSKVFDGTLASVIRSVLQNQTVIAAGTITDLTDNGGGTADGDIEAAVILANHALSGTDSAQKAATEAAFGTVRDALSEVLRQANLIRAVVPAFPALTNNLGGTAPDGTVGAITKTVNGVGTSLASAVGVRSVYAAHYAAVLQATHFVNQLCEAVGVTPVAVPQGAVPGVSTTFAALSTDTGAAVDGSDATNANAGVLATEVSAALTHLADAVKELTTKLNAVTSGTPTITVVAA